MKVNINNNLSFQASFKINSSYYFVISSLSKKRFIRFANARKILENMPCQDELLITLRHNEKCDRLVPVITNLRNDVSVAETDGTSMVKQFSRLLDNIIDNSSPRHRLLFGDGNKRKYDFKGLVSANGCKIPEILPSSPMSQKQINFINEFSRTAKFKYDSSKYMMLPKEKMLSIREHDSGYLYRVTNLKKEPLEQYFYVVYAKDGYQFKFDKKVISKMEVGELFDRYTESYNRIANKHRELAQNKK